MDDITATEEYAYRHIEGFPCGEADQLEDAIARMIDAQQAERDAWMQVGAVALRLRQLARMRHNARQRQLAEARNAKRPAGTERIAG
jgi:hypothetical protein